MMGVITALPGAATPIARILSRFDRAQLEGFISVAIDLLDLADGDPDVEANGDELDGSMGEDDFHAQKENWTGEPGCPISDPGGGDVILAMKPAYGVDQTRGPINVAEAVDEHRAKEMGLERSPGSGWRRKP